MVGLPRLADLHEHDEVLNLVNWNAAVIAGVGSQGRKRRRRDNFECPQGAPSAAAVRALDDFLGRVDSQGVNWGVLTIQEFVGSANPVPSCTAGGHQIFCAPPSAEGARKRSAVVVNARLTDSVRGSIAARPDMVSVDLAWRDRRVRVISAHFEVGMSRDN